MIVDYILAKECKNEDVWYTCYKCGKCGRVFENGYLIDEKTDALIDAIGSVKED